MKIVRLDLLAFGPFSDVSLSLTEGDPGLHIVYGPNEAGKSSSLRALTQLLYGIPHKSSDNFIHAYKDMRLGAVVRDQAGEEIHFIRRKARSKDLREADDTTLFDPARLQAMLGDVDESTFREQFGMDCEELRRGGKAIVDGTGDLGEILFAAGAGVADLRPVQEALNQEAADLFRARGSGPKINKALSELAEARKAIKQTQLPSAQWIEHEQSLRQAIERKEELDAAILEKRAELHRLKRIAKARPLIARQQQLQASWKDVADAPTLPEDFSEIRRNRTHALALAAQVDRDATKALEELAETLDHAEISETLLEHRTSIIKLHKDLGRYEKAAKDRPGLALRQQRAEEAASNILRELGRSGEVTESDAMRLSDSQRLRIQTLANDRKALAERERELAEQVAQLREDGKRIQAELETAASLPDVGPLRHAIHAAQQAGDLDGRIAEAEAEYLRLERQAAIDRDKLPLVVGSIEQVEQLPVPSLETMERHEADRAEASAQAMRIDEELDACREDLRQCDRNLEALQLERDVPTEARLAELRRQRDQAWQWLRCKTASDRSDAEAIGPFVDQFAPGGDLEQAFEASMHAADRMADRLRGEAERVAQKAQLTAYHQELKRKISGLQSQQADARQEEAMCQRKWHGLWEPVGIEPLPPREMIAWSRRHADLVARLESLRDYRTTVEQSRAERQVHCNALRACLADMACPSDDHELLNAILHRCQDRLAQIEDDERQRAARRSELTQIKEALPAAERKARQASEDVERWRAAWGEAVEALGLDRDSDPEEAHRVLAAFDQWTKHADEARDLRSRIAGIDRDAEQFTKLVDHLVNDLGNVATERLAEQTARDLYDRLEATQRLQAKRDMLEKQVARETERRDKARDAMSEHRTILDVFCREARCSSHDDLPEAERRAKRRQDLEREREDLDAQLLELAGGTSLEALLRQADECDTDELPATIRQRTDEIEQLRQDQLDRSEAIGSERRKGQEMEQNDASEEARVRAEHLASQIRTETEQYMRLRLASAVLDRAMQRYRDQNQGPVLERASELFADLTCGSFSRLQADYDDQGQAVLVAVRPDARQQVGVGGLSDGTESQLYLALRLAMLETYLARHEPIPFIVDDILKDYDDDRAVAALKALAQLSEKTQVILFTHHPHLVQLAEANLDSDQVFTHKLADATPAPIAETTPAAAAT